ncbi:DUF2911 domain-containing protein [Brumimicrobium aurantiacum]|uniref:DUF2911 domain-containing protein n=1 Tax=Brumimicrobium aurantiacum TaxID=1737063 RepID=A0A3E1EZ90_9FLAO|nr:DUF2911 domain-containing protein [Brumimicrobium aurantiacum]RFC54882.1 DUF2911 domain-containing protein [Brumimicrobium aurantiacum]
MKKTLFLLSGLFIGFGSMAQVKTPQLSPRVEIEQTVGLTEIEIDYSRPSLRGRDLHKEIIPVGKKWRFGANKNTTISFETPVKFGGKDVKEGEYAMYAVPGEKEWKITLYSDVENWGIPKKWENEKVVAELMVPVTKLKKSVETFTISFDNLTINDFDLNASWGNSMLSIKVELPTNELTVASIKETMNGTPTERDYYSASTYYLNSGTELEKSLEYINKAIELKGDAPFYYVRKKAIILNKLGRNEEAIEAAKVSLKKATDAGNADYIRMNQKSIEEWSK